MAHHLRTVTADLVAEATSAPPFGPGFAESLAGEADRMEIYGSDFSEAGPDYTEFVLYQGTRELGRKRVGGY